jgi:hypothetical protein
MKKLGVLFLATFMFLMVLAPATSVFAATGNALKTDTSSTGSSKQSKQSQDGTGTVAVVLPEGDQKILEETISKQTANLTLDPQKNGGKSGSANLFSGNNFNAASFEKATSDSREIALKQFVDNIQVSGMSDQSQQRVFDQMQSGNKEINRVLVPMVMDSTSADLYSAMRVVAPFLPAVRIIFGVGAILITLLLVGSTIVDLVFIGLPVAREAMSKGKDDGGGGSKPSFVTADAQSVINETESNVGSSGGNGGYKNAYILYFKRRAITYIVLAFILLYLVVGELGGLISWLMTLGDGLVAAGN